MISPKEKAPGSDHSAVRRKFVALTTFSFPGIRFA